MAKDDYDVIVYRVLLYLYGCLKRTIMYEDITFNEAVKKNIENDMYFYDVLRMMQEEGLIEGLIFATAWGGDTILASEIQDAKITPKGIGYLKDNDKMKSIGANLKSAVDIIAKLAALVSI